MDTLWQGFIIIITEDASCRIWTLWTPTVSRSSSIKIVHCVDRGAVDLSGKCYFTWAFHARRLCHFLSISLWLYSWWTYQFTRSIIEQTHSLCVCPYRAAQRFLWKQLSHRVFKIPSYFPWKWTIYYCVGSVPPGVPSTVIKWCIHNANTTT